MGPVARGLGAGGGPRLLPLSASVRGCLEIGRIVATRSENPLNAMLCEMWVWSGVARPWRH